MNRDIITVKLAWEEWNVGIQGNPSIKSLVLMYKHKWRQLPCKKERNTEGQFFRRRKFLMGAIEAKIAEGMSDEAAVAHFEEKRGRKTLDALQKALMKEEQERLAAIEEEKRLATIEEQERLAANRRNS
jgi:hypothetical protein